MTAHLISCLRFTLVASAALLAFVVAPASAELIVEDVVSLSPQQDGSSVEVMENGDIMAIASPPSRVVQITSEGEITVVAGGGDDIPGDGGPATDALLPSPTDVEPLADGGFLVSTVGRVQYVDPEGVIDTVAGMGLSNQGHAGDGGPATEAKIDGASFITATADGAFLLSESANSSGYANNRIREVDANGEINTVAGTSTVGFAGDGGPAISATFAEQGDLDTTADGGFLVADVLNCRIREVDSSGEINTVAGSGSPSIWNPSGGVETCGPVVDNWRVDLGVPGPALEAQLNWPVDVAVEADGGFLFPTRFGQHILRATTGGTTEVVAGTGLQGWGGNGCPAEAVAVDSPHTVAVGDGVIYYADDSLIAGGRVHTVLRRIVEGEVTDCELIGLRGGSADDDIDGSRYSEKILSAGGGDEVAPGGAKDNVIAGGGGDKIDVAGGGTDKVNCGSGRDVVNESGPDRIADNCEVVR